MSARRPVVLFVFAGFLAAGVIRAAEAPSTSVGAAAALERLKTGNARFVEDPSSALPIDLERRASLVAGQNPFATILSCADSRVPPEIVFNTGLGDLFVVRSAGEVIDRSILATLEYGAEHLHVPLLVVMGHEFCGAVKTAVEVANGPKSSLGPNLDFLVKAIQPAVARSARSLFEDQLKSAVLANVEQMIGDIQAQSAILRKLMEERKLQVLGAYYQLSSGEVMFSQPVGMLTHSVKPVGTTAQAAGEHKASAAAPGKR